MTFTTHYSLSIIVFDPDSSGEPQRNFALHSIDELAYSHCIPRTADSCCIYLRDQSNVHLTHQPGNDFAEPKRTTLRDFAGRWSRHKEHFVLKSVSRLDRT